MSDALKLVRPELEPTIMTVECHEPEGIFNRQVRLCVLSNEKLTYLYQRLKPFKTLFNDFVKDNPDAFIKSFVTVDEHGEIHATRLVWEVDDVGILALTDIYPGNCASAHLTFWDQRSRGRERLVRKMMRYVMLQFALHRIEVEVPLYALPVMKMIERIGFIKEGRKRQVVPYEGQWFDTNLYSMLFTEVQELEARDVN